MNLLIYWIPNLYVYNVYFFIFFSIQPDVCIPKLLTCSSLYSRHTLLLPHDNPNLLFFSFAFTNSPTNERRFALQGILPRLFFRIHWL